MDAVQKEIEYALEHPDCAEEVFSQAREVRALHFGNDVFAYGFDYFSTHCKNRCSFCSYRAGNDAALRYRHSADEVVASAVSLAESGVHLVDLTMGEDQYYLNHPERLVALVEAVSQATGLPIMVSPGLIDAAWLSELEAAGATWLALYQETFDREAYRHLRIDQDFDMRLELKRRAREVGLLVEEGILTGWGDTPAQLAHSILSVDAAGPSQVRAMTFVPQEGTPLAGVEARSSLWELLAIAFMRIRYPDKLIPASLDVEGPAGLLARLNAGANVITSIIPPGAGLGGVARNVDIEDGGRTLPQIADTIGEAGLALAPQSRYRAFVEHARQCRGVPVVSLP